MQRTALGGCDIRALVAPKLMSRVALVGAFLSVLSLAACTLGPHYPRETDYPGAAAGIVEVRTESVPGPAVYGPDGRPAVAEVPVKGYPLPLRIETGALIRTPHYFHYQVRAKDGTLHILASDLPFEVGSCVAFSGYADGPSRTHWSLGRVTLERSTDCGK